MDKVLLGKKTLISFFLVLFVSHMACAQRVKNSLENNKDAYFINELFNRGKWEDGKAKIMELWSKNTKDSDLHMLLGKYYVHKKQYDLARFQLVKAIAYAPGNVDAKQLLVAVETDTKRYASAICYVNELLEVNPYWKGLWRKKIELYRLSGNEVEADRLLKRLAQIYPEDREIRQDQQYTMERKASDLTKAGRIDQSIAVERELIDQGTGNESNYVAIIDSYIKAGDLHAALVYTDRALNKYRNNPTFVQKKVALLEQQQRYPELISFLRNQLKNPSSASLKAQYAYFLVEAARNEKEKNPATLYGKILDASPGNKEAFDYVFSDLMGKGMYESAVVALKKYRSSAGESKELDLKELSLYKRMGDQAKITALTKRYRQKYPNDTDIREAYVAIALQEAKANFQDGNMDEAVADWNDVIRSGDVASVARAKQGLYNAYVSEGKYQDAIELLDNELLTKPGNRKLLLKKSDLYRKQGKLHEAIRVYEVVLDAATPEERTYLVSDYADLLAGHVKNLQESYQLEQLTMQLEKWLAYDERNKDALNDMINVSYQTKDLERMLHYAQLAELIYPEDITFKIKVAEAMVLKQGDLAQPWRSLHALIADNPHHTPLVNTFVQTSESYARQLLKDKKLDTAIVMIDTALRYKDVKNLKYLKGLAYEGLKKFDSAYYYQQFYDPSLLELNDFKTHLVNLGQRSLQNVLSIAHLRARFGDSFTVSSISSLDYTHLFTNSAAVSVRMNYTGRENGKGVQGQIEWLKPLNNRLSGRLNVAYSNKHFARLMFNAAALYQFRSSWEVEPEVGFRSFYTQQNLFNLNVGLTKDIHDFRLNAKWSNFYLKSGAQNNYLYSMMGRAQYFISGSKSYVMAMGSIGNSPDVDLIDNQLYNSFNVFNAMVGSGFGWTINKNLATSVVGSWYNFKVGNNVADQTYRNLYNLYFQVDVRF